MVVRCITKLKPPYHLLVLSYLPHSAVLTEDWESCVRMEEMWWASVMARWGDRGATEQYNMEEDPGQLIQPWRQARHTGSFSGLLRVTPHASTTFWERFSRIYIGSHTPTHQQTCVCMFWCQAACMTDVTEGLSCRETVWLKIKMRSATILLRSQRAGFLENKKWTLVLMCKHMPTFHLHNIGSHHHSKRQKCALSQNLQGGRQNITYLVSLSLRRSDNWSVLNQMWNIRTHFRVNWMINSESEMASTGGRVLRQASQWSVIGYEGRGSRWDRKHRDGPNSWMGF